MTQVDFLISQIIFNSHGMNYFKGEKGNGLR